MISQNLSSEILLYNLLNLNMISAHKIDIFIINHNSVYKKSLSDRKRCIFNFC